MANLDARIFPVTRRQKEAANLRSIEKRVEGMERRGTGTISSEELATHTHDIADVTDLQTELDSKTGKFAQTYGDGATLSYVFTHNMGTRDVIVQVYDTASPYSQISVTIEATTINTVTVTHAVAPTTNSRRVVILG